MFLSVYGNCSVKEAERFLRAAVDNNQRHKWYRSKALVEQVPSEAKEESPDEIEIEGLI